ncbi:MAG: tryptophan 7-halogenase [Saprospiraceae bacterium]
MNIAIIGNGIQANIGALYLKKKFGDRVHITRIGPDDRGGFPVVGESIIEITTHFLEEHLGLATYFRDHHLPKYALTYYFKVDPDNPEDRTYSVHCNERAPSNCRMVPGWTGPMDHPPSWLLNRDVFDRDLHQWVDDEPAIRQVKGLVDDVDIHPGGKHLLHVTGTDGTKQTVEADWVIDTTGRRQLLGRKFNLVVKPEGQRDCFWFRIKNFDKSLLKNVNALGPMPAGPGEEYHYERYYSTHHFMGKGFWIWLIPMKGENGEDMMSIGFTSHPDHFQGNVRNIEGFLAETDKSHRVVSDLVRSGEVMDINKMVRYHYVVKQVYSPDRWAIIGDAAYARILSSPMDWPSGPSSGTRWGNAHPGPGGPVGTAIRGNAVRRHDGSGDRHPDGHHQLVSVHARSFPERHPPQLDRDRLLLRLSTPGGERLPLQARPPQAVQVVAEYLAIPSVRHYAGPDRSEECIGPGQARALCVHGQGKSESPGHGHAGRHPRHL